MSVSGRAALLTTEAGEDNRHRVYSLESEQGQGGGSGSVVILIQQGETLVRMALFILLLTLLQPDSALAQQPTGIPTVDVSVEVFGRTLVDFSTKMDAYAELRRSLEEGLPPLRVTDNPSEIRQAELLLAQRIRNARAGTGRGDIFTEDIRRGFRQLLRPVTNAGTCELIQDDNPGEFRYEVNSAYPKDKPFSSVPASMLKVLPRLPQDVWYRFLDRDLILHDSRANVILDRIDDAVRCPAPSAD